MPPVHTCGAPLSTAGKNEYWATSGQAIGSAVEVILPVIAPDPQVGCWLSIRAATPATWGDAIEVPCW